MRAIAIIALSAQAGCAPEVPSEPTWVDDVRPILVANCVRCHSVPPLGGAPGGFRLDAYGAESPEEADATGEPYGARLMDGLITARTEAKTMPPRLSLTGRQIEVLAAWQQAGSPRGVRADNRAPEISIVPERDGPQVVLAYTIEDPDEELVTGSLFADPGDGERLLVSVELFSGRGEIGWSTDAIEPGSYDLVAELDDGSGVVEVDAGSVEVTP